MCCGSYFVGIQKIYALCAHTIESNNLLPTTSVGVSRKFQPHVTLLPFQIENIQALFEAYLENAHLVV